MNTFYFQKRCKWQKVMLSSWTQYWYFVTKKQHEGKAWKTRRKYNINLSCEFHLWFFSHVLLTFIRLQNSLHIHSGNHSLTHSMKRKCIYISTNELIFIFTFSYHLLYVKKDNNPSVKINIVDIQSRNTTFLLVANFFFYYFCFHFCMLKIKYLTVFIALKLLFFPKNHCGKNYTYG